MDEGKQNKPSVWLRLGMTLGVRAVSLGTMLFRNDLAEFCTTQGVRLSLAVVL